MALSSLYQRIYAVVRRIPRGRVATYGQVAVLARIPFHARQVGYALHALPAGTRLPWHRVINSRGGISVRASCGGDAVQRIRLEQEGVKFDARGCIELRRFQWRLRLARGRAIRRTKGGREVRESFHAAKVRR